MRIAEVDLPVELLDAQQEGRLVIFAGAGVSIPPPSNLPTFEGLAKELASGTIEYDGDEPFDRFLGRVEDGGANIRGRASRYLTRAETKPNSLHKDIVGLFDSPDKLRIVTTNFDHHFETTISARWNTVAPEIFAAPALPLGDDFAGLVYLHGKAGDDKNLVLTDRDFGEAYLTRGWATRFLDNLFGDRIVLFVGYSHDDVDMTYLARGLSTRHTSNRFALVDSKKPSENWQFLGIEPIIYDYDENHSKVQELMDSWVSLSQRGALDREKHIHRIVERGPEALTVEEADYLEYSLSRPEWAQFFFRYALDPGWLEWTFKRDLLNPLAEEIDAPVSDFASWFVEDALSKRGEKAWKIASLSQTLTREVWQTLAWKLWRELQTETPRSRDQSLLLAKWVSVLVRKEPSNAIWGALGYWLKELERPEEDRVILDLLDVLTSPFVVVRKPIYREVQHEIQIRGDKHPLLAFLNGLEAPLSPRFAQGMLGVSLNNLERAHGELELLDAASERVDYLSSLRSRVSEANGSLSRSNAILLLVDYATAAIESLTEVDESLVKNHLLAYLDSRAPLVKRICIHGIETLESLDCEEKIELLLAKQWLENSALRPEVFSLLFCCYPKLTGESRTELLREARKAFEREDDRIEKLNPEAKKSADYEMFNLLVWLGDADPECRLVQREMVSLQHEHPDYSSRDHPDLVHYASGVHSIQTVSDYDVSEILSWPPEEYMAKLEEVREEPRDFWKFEDRVRGFLEVTSEAVAERPSWGIEVAEDLLAREDWDSSLWRSLFRGWQEAGPEGDLLDQIAILLGKDEEVLEQFGDSAAELLLSWLEVDRSEYPEGICEPGLRIATSILDIAPETRVELGNETSWLSEAVGRTTGKLARFLLRSVEAHWQQDGKPAEWTIPSELSNLLERLIDTQAFGRAVLAGNLHFFLYVDEEWTAEHLLPLFSPMREARPEVWDGFVDWGRRNPKVLEHLSPHLLNVIANQEKLSKYARKRLPRVVADFAYLSEDDPWPFLQSFLKSSSDDTRATLADRLVSILEDLTEDKRTYVWETWVEEYLRLRAEEVPPLENQEKRSLLRWWLVIPEHIRSITESLISTQSPRIRPWELTEWKDKCEKIPSTDRNSLSRLLVWVLQGLNRDDVNTFVLQNLRELLNMLRKDTDHFLFKELVENFVTLGGTGGEDLLS